MSRPRVWGLQSMANSSLRELRPCRASTFPRHERCGILGSNSTTMNLSLHQDGRADHALRVRIPRRNPGADDRDGAVRLKRHLHPKLPQRSLRARKRPPWLQAKLRVRRPARRRLKLPVMHLVGHPAKHHPKPPPRLLPKLLPKCRCLKRRNGPRRRKRRKGLAVYDCCLLLD